MHELRHILQDFFHCMQTVERILQTVVPFSKPKILHYDKKATAADLRTNPCVPNKLRAEGGDRKGKG